MKRTMTVNLKNIKFISSNIFEQIIKNRRKLLLTVLSVLGLWCGTRIYITESEIISEYFSEIKIQSLKLLISLLTQ